MGAKCGKMDESFEEWDGNVPTQQPRSTPETPDSHRPSLFRVGSEVLFRSPSRRRTRAQRMSTYNHVQDAVMYNIREAGAAEHGPAPAGVVGLRNLGNTCFMNSSLQCLSNTIPLTDYFLGYEYRKEINRDNFLGTGGKLVTAYAELVKKMWLGRKSAVEPSRFKKQLATFAPQFNGTYQHDAHELLSFLLDGIHEDLNRVQKKPYIEDKDCDGTNDAKDAIEAWSNYLKRNKSLIVDIFQGQFRNTCLCKQCGHRNIRFEPFMYLSLPISDSCETLQDCLDLYLKVDTLEGENQWYCEKCKDHVDAIRKIDIWILPPILIIHLKRFKYDEYGQVGSKNNATLEYPIQSWDLSQYVHGQGSSYPCYDLYAVSNHLGGLGSGHYTAHALNRFNDEWYEFNDSTCRMVSESDIRCSSSAYLLFYNRSEGDVEAPSSRRTPLIRRQSISRPDLWPHGQVVDADFRDFRRSSRRHLSISPSSTGVEIQDDQDGRMDAIAEGSMHTTKESEPSDRYAVPLNGSGHNSDEELAAIQAKLRSEEEEATKSNGKEKADTKSRRKTHSKKKRGSTQPTKRKLYTI